ncbi:hypothetical protein JAAARDRAFT_46613 [Jaapia argillacea MUCL 33604]|uniref:Uncharacterized protein n=1 Tax=Jaapia argillacea MUCL 33604 TaxID=933084 RepID=A0A067PW08_9AGAM|nr:hypothetical protein JAAARDRAFT_46613 [Jaapia argillacea MUCL 33604]
MVNESYCEVTNGRDIPDIVKGGSNASPPEVRVPEGSAIRGSSAEPSYTIPLDSNSLVTPNTALNANPPFSAESPPELSSNADPPIPAPSSTLESESFQRFYADCSKFSAEKPPIADYSLERKRQFVATMLLEWERLRVNAEVFNPDQTVQAELTSVKDSLEMFERRLAGPQKILSSVLRLLYARLSDENIVEAECTIISKQAAQVVDISQSTVGGQSTNANLPNRPTISSSSECAQSEEPTKFSIVNPQISGTPPGPPSPIADVASPRTGWDVGANSGLTPHTIASTSADTLPDIVPPPLRETSQYDPVPQKAMSPPPACPCSNPGGHVQWPMQMET